MLTYKTITRLSLFLAILVWLLLAASELFILFSEGHGLSAGIGRGVPKVLYNVFLLTLYLYYRYSIGKAENFNFLDLLWRIFVTGLIATVVSLALKFFTFLLGTSTLVNAPLFIDLRYLVNLGLASTFLLSTFTVWKRLILYQKSKFLLSVWNVFEYALLASLAYSVLFPFNVLRGLFFPFLIVLILMGMFLSANMKWVAYLNFRQKWKSILLILLSMLYLTYFAMVLFNEVTIDSDELNFISDFRFNIYVLALFSFIFVYALFSLLVILFNLPTSSVFEKKLAEVVNFQRLSQSIQTEQNEDQVYGILLESAASTVLADAAWVEVYNTSVEPGRLTPKSSFISHHISEEEILNLKEKVSFNTSNKSLFGGEKDLMSHSLIIKLNNANYKSAMGFEINIQNEAVGAIILLKDVTDGFNKEMSNIIRTFVNQASISIENFRLLRKELENERYKEEVKIAKRVQSSLLPDVLDHNEDFDIVAFSEAADEVGGDYYDTYRISPTRTAVIIGDVSGKGTSAAFQMSQMKGIFHSLVLGDPSPGEFLEKANSALSRCLEKTSFITTSYFVIDSNAKQLSFARAGHCPTLYYQLESNQLSYLDTKGLGLGILRGKDYRKYVSTNTKSYASGDLIILYTDGITEAKNSLGEEFGFDRLQEIVSDNLKASPRELQEQLIEALYQFSGVDTIDDDFTTLIIKFK